MTICPTCAARQPGEKLCPLHPHVSAWRDQRTQKKMTEETIPNQLADICTWVSLHTNQIHITAVYILGYICDKCGNQVTVSLCAECAQNWGGIAPNARCGTCTGTLSWQLHNITTGEALTQINPSQL